MKKTIILLVMTLLLGYQAVWSQSALPSNYDPNEYYSLVTKGAFWSTRPEAKEVFEGKIPSSVLQVKVAHEPFLLRYAEKEHTAKDRNFIIAPTGSRFYEMPDGWHDSYCGNLLDYCQLLSKSNVQKVIDTVYIVKNTTNNSVIHDTVWMYKFKEDQQYQTELDDQQITVVNIIDGGQPTYHQEYCPILPTLVCMAMCPPMQPIYYGGASNNTYIDNSSHYYNNINTTTNTTTGGRVTPPSHTGNTNTGGRVTPPSHTGNTNTGGRVNVPNQGYQNRSAKHPSQTAPQNRSADYHPTRDNRPTSRNSNYNPQKNYDRGINQPQVRQREYQPYKNQPSYNNVGSKQRSGNGYYKGSPSSSRPSSGGRPSGPSRPTQRPSSSGTHGGPRGHR